MWTVAFQFLSKHWGAAIMASAAVMAAGALAVAQFDLVKTKGDLTATVEAKERVEGERDQWARHAGQLQAGQDSLTAAVRRIENSQAQLNTQLRRVETQLGAAQLREQANENPTQLDSDLNDRMRELGGLRDQASGNPGRR